MNDDARMVRAIVRRLNWLAWGYNVSGGAVVFMAVGFLAAVFFDAEQRDELGRENLPLILVSAPALGIGALLFLRGCHFRALAWISEGRAPTDEEHAATLRLPAVNALVTAGVWTIGGLLGFVFNLDHSLGTAVLCAVPFWLGGETTSALAYLVTERQLRPVIARALAVREPTRTTAPGIRHRLLYAWSLGTAVPVMSVLAVGIVGLTRPAANLESVAAAGVFLAGVALVVGLIATLAVARAISDPLKSIRGGVERVAAGDLGVQLAIDDASEVGLVQAGFNRMAEGLRERERIRDLFGRQVGEDVAHAALSEGVRLGGEEREIGALFVDLQGSTAIAVAMPPTEVVRLLNKFFRVVIEVVEAEGGFVNKFEGDAALCVFGAPAPSPDPAGRALCAARNLADRLEREVPEIGFGIGVSAGRAVAGNVGAEHRFEYTVIGDPVNEAARLSDLAKEREVHAVASDAALDRAAPGEAERWEVGERTVLRGRLDATVLASPRA